ncbi:Protein SLG1 [Fusarium oxysporum f. sp. cubense race 1]|uniref:Protein SLG1 n=1 Tax=Fusarium oxysporum f. sp. cubense (strain race 1) TaxID=1229664 RepID=N4UZ13_FUSC1|nr:Protein SLG1 [Fusarium oxysporum f. sp. cubense race 1]
MAFTKVALLSLLSLVAARDALQSPAESPVLGEITPQGCFDSLPSQVDGRSNTFNSVGSCADYCQKQKKTVAILKDVECICADVYPAKSALVDDDKCDTPCPGYSNDACGGEDAYSVFNLGVNLLPGNEGDKRSSGSTAELTGSTKTAVVTTATEVSTTNAETTSAPTTEAEETTSATKPDKASATEATTSGSTAASTPSASASSVPDNASRRLNNPIGNLIALLRHLL